MAQNLSAKNKTNNVKTTVELDLAKAMKNKQSPFYWEQNKQRRNKNWTSQNKQLIVEPMKAMMVAKQTDI